MHTRKPPINFRLPPSVRKGPARFSKRVQRRIDAANTFCASITTFKDHVSDGFGERFSGQLRAGEALPDAARALDDFDGVYGEALAYALAVYRLAGIDEKKILRLRPAADRRRLMREAGQERQARAQGRRRAGVEPLRSAWSTTARWLQSFRSRVA